jgi:hypothetical protein
MFSNEISKENPNTNELFVLIKGLQDQINQERKKTESDKHAMKEDFENRDQVRKEDFENRDQVRKEDYEKKYKIMIEDFEKKCQVMKEDFEKKCQVRKEDYEKKIKNVEIRLEYLERIERARHLREVIKYVMRTMSYLCNVELETDYMDSFNNYLEQLLNDKSKASEIMSLLYFLKYIKNKCNKLDHGISDINLDESFWKVYKNEFPFYEEQIQKDKVNDLLFILNGKKNKICFQSKHFCDGDDTNIKIVEDDLKNWK